MIHYYITAKLVNHELIEQLYHPAERSEAIIYKHSKFIQIMGSAAVKIKIMPDSPDANLKEIEDHVEKLIVKEGGKIAKIEREPIAFGLNAILVTFAWQEDADRDLLEEKIRKLPHINSADIIDFRRAFG